MRLTTKDGDVLEVRGSYDYAAVYAKTTYGPAGQGPGARHCKGAGQGGDQGAGGAAAPESDALEPAKDKPGKAGEWIRGIKDELRKQQLELLEKTLKGLHAKDAGDGRFVMVTVSASEETLEIDGSDDAVSAVPDYWNAENTSQRIVDFATSFAALHGEDPEAFAKTIKQAVADGFEQAHAATGDLPGAAGKLYQDTKDLVFAKLDKWLEAWKGGSYDQKAQLSEPALAA